MPARPHTRIALDVVVVAVAALFVAVAGCGSSNKGSSANGFPRTDYCESPRFLRRLGYMSPATAAGLL
jgi:hypothetical protein